MKAWALLAVATVAIVIVAVVVMRPDPADPEDQVRQTLAEAVDAAERRHVGDLMELVSESFKAEGMTRDTIKGVLFIQFRRGDWSRVFLVDTHIEIRGDAREARVRTGAILATGEKVDTLEDVVPTAAGSYRFDIMMAKEEDGVWRVTTAKWATTPLGGLLGGP